MSIKDQVLSQVKQVSAEQNKTLAPLSDDLPLVESGLDSLCLAVVIARLEDLLGVDPFNTSAATPFPVTVGDLVSCYENAVG